MDEEQLQQVEQEVVKESWYAPLARVTPFSKYLAMALFVAMAPVVIWLGLVHGTGVPDEPTAADLLSIEFVETNAWINMMPGSYSEHIVANANIMNNSTVSLENVRIVESSLVLDGEPHEGRVYFYIFEAKSCDDNLRKHEFIESINIPAGCELKLAFRSGRVDGASRAGLRFSLANGRYRSEELTTPEGIVDAAY